MTTKRGYVPITGWIKRGPDFGQNFVGWRVYAQKQDPEDIPVTITVGHPERRQKDEPN